jgi:hypothetical protein
MTLSALLQACLNYFSFCPLKASETLGPNRPCLVRQLPLVSPLDYLAPQLLVPLGQRHQDLEVSMQLYV